MQLTSGSTIKGYKVTDYLTEGGMGGVYRAYQETAGREVAIKVILPKHANTPDFIRRFEAEAQVIARLEHPYIVPLYDYWRDPNGAYLVMRLLRGGSLKDLIKQHGALSVEDAVLMIDHICQALHKAHRNQVIHRDIKPGNILLDEDGNAYLADFGIAKDHATVEDATNAEAITGTPEYLSPEQARSEPVTPQTDIYSLGVVLYEMLAGEHPFPNSSQIQHIFNHLNEPLPEIITLTDSFVVEINEVIQKATAKDPSHRYDDALAFSMALREAAGLDRTPTPVNMIELLTPREQEVIKLIVEGKTNRQIAEALVVEVSTVKWYVKQIYKKLGVRSRVQAILKARDLDLIHGKPDAVSIMSLSHLPEPDNPYKGLQAFQAGDEHVFFGREKLTKKLLARLEEKGDYQHFLALVGPSGSGKSSVVKAGLIPAIWRGDINESENWYIIDMMPGNRPLDELEVALYRIAGESKLNLREQLERDENGLLRVADMILPDDGSQLLLVIDQFEEVFTFVEDEAKRQHFLSMIMAAITAPRSRVRIVVTIRADYYDRPLQYPEFGELIRNRVETILPLSAEELERAINEPAYQVGVSFEEGLVSRIVSDVHYQPGALPLLQYALTELFEHRDGRNMTLQAYQDIGGTGGALAKRADELFLEGDEERQTLIKQMFLRLVTLGEGAEDTRRRVERAELLEITNTPELMDDIIDMYALSRLLSLDHDPATRQPTVEVAHEAILREWDRLRQWLNESREDIRQERELARAANDWSANNHDHSYLLRGARLEQAEQWMNSTELILTPLEREYIESSAIRRAEEEQEQRVQRRTRRNLVMTAVAILVIGIVVSTGFGVFAVDQANDAQFALNESERIRLAAQAQNVLNSGTSGELPALLALRSLERGYSPDADAALLTALDRGFPIREFVGHTDFISWADISPDGLSVATVGSEGVVIIWDMQTGEEIQRLAGQPSDFWSAEFSPDGKTIVTGGVNGSVRTWDVDSGNLIQELATFPYRIWGSRFTLDGQSIAISGGETVYLLDAQSGEEIRQFIGRETINMGIGFSKDGQYLCAGGLDGKNHIWQVSTGVQLRVLEGHDGFTACENFSPDGQYVLTAGEDSTVIMWDIASGRQIHYLDQHVDNAGTAEFSQDGQYILSSDFGGNAYLWDADTGELLNQYRGHTGSIEFAKMSPDMNYILTVGHDSRVLLWPTFDIIEPRNFSVPILPHTTQAHVIDYELETSTLMRVLTAGQVYTWNTNSDEEAKLLFNMGFNTAAELSEDNQFIIAGYENGEVKLWDIDSGDSTLRFDAHDDAVQALALAPDNLSVITSGADNTLRLWNIGTGAEIRQFDGETQGINAIAFAPDGLTFATGDADGILRLWDNGTGNEIQQFEGHTDAILAVAFSPDGNAIVTASADDMAILWDVTSGQILQNYIGHTNQVTSVDFSSDGRQIITGSFDRTARLWDTDSGNTIRYFTGHVTPVSAVTLASNGEYAFSADNSNTFRWLVNLDEVTDIACNRLPRDFHANERTLYKIGDELSTCDQGTTVVSRVEPTWTPYPTNLPLPTGTVIPDEPTYVVEFDFLNDEEVISCCTMPPFVFVLEDENTVKGFTELTDDILNSELFTSDVPVDIGFLPPFSTGPYPLGQPLGFTVTDWLASRGSGTYTEINDRATLELEFHHLVPNGLYTLWCVEQTNVPYWQVVEELPCGAIDGSENTFTADANGFAEFNIEIDAFPPATEEEFYGIAIAYHSDGQTHGTSVGEHGHTAHVQMFYDFLPGS